MSKSTLAGLGGLAAFIAAIIFGVNATHGFPIKERETVEAVFDNVSGLTVGDDVRIASVRVGFVQELGIKDGEALAVLKIDDPDTRLYADATAGVIDRSGFGQKFVALDPGTPGSGDLGGMIPRERTIRAQDVNELLDEFDPKTRAAVSSTLTQFGGGMTGHAQDLNDLLTHAPGILDDTASVSTALTSSNADLVGLMQSADLLAARFRGHEQHAANVLDQLGETFSAFAVDDGAPLRQTIEDAPETLGDLKTTLDDLRDPLKHTANAMTDLEPGAKALGKATPDLRAFLRESTDPLQDVPQFSKSAEPAVESLTRLVHDARPLARQLIKTGASADPMVSVVTQYVPEIVRYFKWGSSFLGYPVKGDLSTEDVGYYTRFLVVGGGVDVGGIGVSDLFTGRNVYGKPGETDVRGEE